MKVVYKIKKDGVIRFLVNGEDLSVVANRIRILYRTLRSRNASASRQHRRAAGSHTIAWNAWMPPG